MPPITFTDRDFQGIDPVQDDPMVISVEINNCIVKKTLVDQGSSADILYWKTFEQLGIPEQELTPYDEPLVGFSGERVDTRGTIDLYTYFGDDQRRRIKVRYVVVNANSSYNILLGRPSLNKLRAIVSTPHLAMKFPSEERTVITMHADHKTARKCYFASLRVLPTPKPGRDVNVIGDVRQKLVEGLELDPRMEDEDRVEPIETTVPFQLGKNEEQVTFLSSQLSGADARDIKQVLRKYSDLFAWTAADMPGIDPSFHCHRLSVCRDAKPIAQKKRKMGGERAQAIKEETTKLLQARFIREVKYSTWLANVVMVKKSNGKWRMCTNYTDLNKACPKDAYPLPHIDALVDGAADHHRLSFLDAYSGYNQIPMYPPDEAKTAFITDSANFCYRVMPFGLRNAGATY
ncbi:uncharacterized protein LOC109800394 [Cajanus cajan]|uniref:uncharacterized protein LOC109800394 n=1 Tax=Cajanus cajan TaxID=3821 RepID=UPI00098DA548|nr:uncharacterized protein LOC109800394 [Cajanus cajan]